MRFNFVVFPMLQIINVPRLFQQECTVVIKSQGLSLLSVVFVPTMLKKIVHSLYVTALF